MRAGRCVVNMLAAIRQNKCVRVVLYVLGGTPPPDTVNVKYCRSIGQTKIACSTECDVVRNRESTRECDRTTKGVITV